MVIYRKIVSGYILLGSIIKLLMIRSNFQKQLNYQRRFKILSITPLKKMRSITIEKVSNLFTINLKKKLIHMNLFINGEDNMFVKTNQVWFRPKQQTWDRVDI